MLETGEASLAKGATERIGKVGSDTTKHHGTNTKFIQNFMVEIERTHNTSWLKKEYIPSDRVFMKSIVQLL